MTVLEIVNTVLRRLRETTVASIDSTTYSTLITDFVSDIHKEMIDAHRWRSMDRTVDVPVDASQRVLNLSLKESGEAFEAGTKATFPRSCRTFVGRRFRGVFYAVLEWWKRFPGVESGEPIDAPMGPGVYEVRHTLTGRVVAFGPSSNVAEALTDLNLNGGPGAFARFFGRQPSASRLADLEYRTCSAASRAEAKVNAHRLLGLRQSACRRRMDLGGAARAS